MTDTERERINAICEVAGVNEIDDLSDGFHTFRQLYYQRMMLFAALVRQNKDRAWKSLRHEDGELCFGGGWFIVGIDTPEGSYTYHYENNYYSLFDCEELERGKHWDGHTEKDVTRLLSLPKAQLSCEGTTSDTISKTETVEHLRRVLEATVPNTDYDEGFIDGVEFGISTVSAMPSALNNQVNLCNSCTYTYPECPSEKDDVIFGNGIGNDNICACNKYQPTVQPVATDTNVGDTISRQQAIDALDKRFDNIPMEQTAEILKLRKDLRELPTIQPEPHWILCSERMPEEHEWLGTKKFGTTISDEVYVTFENEKGERFCKHMKFQNGELGCYDKLFIDSWFKGSKPIAWMPLPEPYEEASE